jgi:hypothetical protein
MIPRRSLESVGCGTVSRPCRAVRGRETLAQPSVPRTTEHHETKTESGSVRDFFYSRPSRKETIRRHRGATTTIGTAVAKETTLRLLQQSDPSGRDLSDLADLFHRHSAEGCSEKWRGRRSHRGTSGRRPRLVTLPRAQPTALEVILARRGIWIRCLDFTTLWEVSQCCVA